MRGGVIITALAYVGLARLMAVNLGVFVVRWLVVVVAAIVVLYRYLVTKGVVLCENLG